MTKPPPDLASLARRYVELWQEQMAAAVTDPQAGAALVRLLQQAGKGLADSAGLWQHAWWQLDPEAGSAAGVKAHARAEAPVPPGSTASADPSRDGGGDLAQLAHRVAALEARLAALDAGASGARRKPRPRSRGRRAD